MRRASVEGTSRQCGLADGGDHSLGATPSVNPESRLHINWTPPSFQIFDATNMPDLTWVSVS
jgi:hypothetical protein